MAVIDRLVARVKLMPPLVVDGAVGAASFAIACLGQLTAPDSVLPHAQRPAALGLLLVACLGVAVRRRSSWAACILVLLAALGGTVTWNDYWGNLLPEVVILYTISEQTGTALSLLALIGACVVRFLNTGPFFGPDVHYRLSDLPKLVQTDFWYLALAWFAGRAQARRRAIASDLARRAEDLRRERERLTRDAVMAERARIARELHALVVGGVRRMIAATRQAMRLLGSDPTRAARSIAAIETTGRDTLVHMRRLLLVLRSPNDALAPLPAGASLPANRLKRPLFHAECPRGAPSPIAQRGGRAWSLIGRARSWVSAVWVTDMLVVLAMTALAVAESFSYPGFPYRRIDIVLTSAVTGVLLFRRRLPVPVLAVAATSIFVWNAFFIGAANAGDRALFIAVYTVAVLRGPWWSVVAIGAQVIAYVPTIFERPQVNWPYDLAGFSALFLLIVIAGLAVRESGWLRATLLDQTEFLRRTREQRVLLAVDEERTRIARDVHDTVAHGVSLMVIQAGAARWLAETDERRANDALSTVEWAGQKAAQELQSLVGAPGTSSEDHHQTRSKKNYLTIEELVDEAGHLGRVELMVRGERRELDAGLEVSLSRIVQEALTNVRKHAPGARVRVEITYAPDGIEVEVTDTGGNAPSRADTLPGAGHGLIGIAERAALFGGRVEAGPTAQGGFRVRAYLAKEPIPV